MNYGWHDESVRRLREMLEGGYTMREVALVLGISRNAVIGKAHRLGVLSQNNTGEHKKAKPTVTPVVAAKPVAKDDKPAAKPEPAPVVAASRFFQTDIPASNGGVTLTELTASTCRWPCGDPREESFRFCGDKTSFDRTYCDHHHAIAYVPAPKRDPKKQRDEGRGARFARDLGRFSRFATGAMQ